MPKKDEEKEAIFLIKTILLNRTLQLAPKRKSLHQIAKRHNCDDAKVGRAEVYLLEKLLKKISILEVLINVNK